jgi:predicted transcriptional regulator
MAESNRPSMLEGAGPGPAAGQFQIVRLATSDALRFTDHLRALRSLIVCDELTYPGIGKWFDARVVPGLATGERIAYLAYRQERPVASAVLKQGPDTKFCHLRIREECQGLDLGQALFSLMTLEVRGIARRIHFTLPESLWARKKPFFKSFGFPAAWKARRQYRHGDAELRCSAGFPAVWRAVFERLARWVADSAPEAPSVAPPLLMSIKPAHWARIVEGGKLFEFRKRFGRRWAGRRAVFYASRPVCSLVGEAALSAVTSGRPDQVWSLCEGGAGVERSEFDAYVGSARVVAAIELAEVRSFPFAVAASRLANLVGRKLPPPQSFCELRAEGCNPWPAAVGLAKLMQFSSGGPGQS